MGNSISVNDEQSDIWWPPPSTHTNELEQISSLTTNVSTQTEENNTITQTSEQIIASTSKTNEEINETSNYKKQNELKLQHFKSDFDKKHLARREAIAERSREMMFLREELIKYKKENEQLKDLLKQNNESNENILEENIEEVKCDLQRLRNENEELQNKISQLNEELNRSNEISKQNTDLRKSIAETQKDLQAVNAQVIEFEKERHDYETHVVALKDVITVSKRLLEIRENQLQELKTKVTEIETGLAEREVSMMSQNLKDEYERQLVNIRNLRALYEQRQSATKAERDLMASQLTDAKNNLENEQKRNGELEERIGELENNVSDKYDEIKSLESQLGLAKAEFRGLETEMSAINQLFSQILYGFNTCQEIDFDKLIKLLEENHDLLTNIAINEECESMSHAMPKVLLDLVNQVNEIKAAADLEPEDSTDLSSCEASGSEQSTTEESQQTEQQSCNTMNSAEEIVSKLPKVWRVLTELLRQQSGQLPVNIEPDGTGTDPCYKSIETPKGPKLVLSVSQTFIRLKDLILEKKSLEKETSRLKQLNTHLETRLQDQEKRLETVSTELSKTWHVVGRMQRQHQQLHTHEKILRYELAQKRKMLTELKEELEYCREKWIQAREKNSNTEEEWKKLRSEFASRKTVVADDLNNSAESGYSDERECSSDEEYNTEKRKKLVTKIPVAEQASDQGPSDTDTEELSAPQNDETEIKINKLENFVKNQDEENSTESNVETGINKEGDDALHSTVEEKTDFEVQNQREKTMPASLDMIDNVCALGTIPVVISESQNSEDTPSTLDMIDNVCALGTMPIVISESLGQSSEDTSSTLNIVNNECALETIPVVISESQSTEETQFTLDMTDNVCTLETIPVISESPDNQGQSSEDTPSTLDMIDNICALGTIPVITESRSTEETPCTLDMIDNVCGLETIPAVISESQGQSAEETSAILDMVDNVCALETIPVVITESPSTEETPCTLDMSAVETIPVISESPDSQGQSSKNTSSTLDMIDNVCALETIPVVTSENQSTASTSSITPTQREISQDERLRKREERLSRLEEQCKQLVTKVTNTTNRSTEICNRLETLHEQYGNDNTRSDAQQPENNSE